MTIERRPVTALKGVGPALASRLAKLGIEHVADLLFWLPNRYEDRTRIVPIGALRPGMRAYARFLSPRGREALDAWMRGETDWRGHVVYVPEYPGDAAMLSRIDLELGPARGRGRGGPLPAPPARARATATCISL